MPELEYFVVAESVSIDQDTNRVSLFNVLETIESDLPHQIAQFTAVAVWLSQQVEEGRDCQAMLKVRVPGEDKDREFPVNFTVISLRNRTIIQVEGLTVPQHGDVKFSLFLNGVYAASHTISVVPPISPHSGARRIAGGSEKQAATSE